MIRDRARTLGPLLAALGWGLAAPAQAQSTSMQDFEWTLAGGQLGVAQLDLVAGTMFLYPQTPDFVLPQMTFKTVAPYDGTVTVGVTTVAHDPPFDAAIRVVGDHSAGLTAVTGSTTISFDVFADTAFGLGVQGDDCCGSIEVLYHDFVFAPKTPTPAVSPALDVRLEQTVPAQHAFWPQLEAIGDVNSDDITDFVLGSVAPPAQTHHLSVISGADLSTLFSLSQMTGVFGEYVSGCGDFDLDAIPDYLAGDTYSFSVRSGSTNAVLATFFNFDYGGSIRGACGAGDIDRDGITDLWILTYSALKLVSGAEGNVIHNHATPPIGAFTSTQSGDALDRLGDVNGDGIDDAVIGVTPQAYLTTDSHVRIVSGATGFLIREYVDAPATLLGYAVASAGDVDGDGVDDVLAGAPGALDGRGEAHVWSGATGAALHHFVGTDHSGLGGVVDGAGDVDGDGLADVLLGNRANETPNAQPDGRVELRAGADGSVLQLFEQPAEGDFGRALVGGVDLDLDGEPELVVAALRDGPQGTLSRYDDLTLPYGVSSLTGAGTLLPGTPFKLRLIGGPPAGVAHLVAGLAWIAAPFKGGTLIPQPDIVLLGLPLGPNGELTLTSTWPAGVPSGALLAVQCWLPDVHGPAGFGASNGVLFLAP